jgi:hypothetical protein
METIEGQAFQGEGNGPLPCSGLQTELVEQTAATGANAEPSTQNDIDAIRLYAFASPGLPLDRHTAVIFCDAGLDQRLSLVFMRSSS